MLSFIASKENATPPYLYTQHVRLRQDMKESELTEALEKAALEGSTLKGVQGLRCMFRLFVRMFMFRRPSNFTYPLCCIPHHSQLLWPPTFLMDLRLRNMLSWALAWTPLPN